MYGLPHSRILPPQKGYRNTSYGVVSGARMLNLILYKREPHILARIKNANLVGDFLAGQGLPARATHSPRIIKLQAGARVGYGALYRYLPGNTIPWEAYSKDHIKALGATMSHMHAALQKLSAPGLPKVAADQQALLARMQRYFAQTGVRQALSQKLNLVVAPPDLAQLLALCGRLPGQQPLHMDFVRGNILFQGKTVSGILDFEKAAAGHPIFDIARSLAFLLVDCKFKPEAKIRKYFLRSGYHKRGRAPYYAIKIGQTNLLEQLLDFFLLYDFYKFLRHNPYESLPHNHHFVRTRDLLLKRGVIRYNK